MLDSDLSVFVGYSSSPEHNGVDDIALLCGRTDDQLLAQFMGEEFLWPLLVFRQDQVSWVSWNRGERQQ